MTGGTKQIHSGHRQRLRERALNEGLDGFSDVQALELLLFYARARVDTNEIAHALLERFGRFDAVLNAPPQELQSVPGVGAETAALLTLLPEFFRRYQLAAYPERTQLNSRADLMDYAVRLFIGFRYEAFYLICLDGQNRVNHAALLNQGSLSEVTVYPRVAVETALRFNARNVVLAHNHPGGVMRPTAADVQLTQRISAVLEEIGIGVLDHLIVSGDECYSFTEKGLMNGRI